MNRKTLLALTLSGLAALAPSSAFGDWIVLETGERIETRGAWKIEGSRVLFTGTNGALSSIRLSQVDVEASEAANRPAPPQAKPEPAAERPRREPALVLNNSNVARARRVDSADTDGTSDEAVTAAEKLSIASWQETEAGLGGLKFGGTLQNPTENFAVLVEVQATLYDAEGSLLETARGKMPAASVGPLETQTFEVAFPDVYAYSNIEFDVTYKFLKGEGEDTPPSPDGDDEESSEAESDSLPPNAG
ncbi:MAG: FxLYD domain-containing protein [Acidobacteriota bacterium]